MVAFTKTFGDEGQPEERLEEVQENDTEEPGTEGSEAAAAMRNDWAAFVDSMFNSIAGSVIEPHDESYSSEMKLATARYLFHLFENSCIIYRTIRNIVTEDTAKPSILVGKVSYYGQIFAGEYELYRYSKSTTAFRFSGAFVFPSSENDYVLTSKVELITNMDPETGSDGPMNDEQMKAMKESLNTIVLYDGINLNYQYNGKVKTRDDSVGDGSKVNDTVSTIACLDSAMWFVAMHYKEITCARIQYSGYLYERFTKTCSSDKQKSFASFILRCRGTRF